MTAEQWEQIKDVFDAALQVPAPGRKDYVLSACGDQTPISRTVLELLENHSDSTSSLRPAGVAHVHVLTEGQLVASRFRIVRFIAAGGMGEVYEAYDEWLRLRLALKTLRPDLIPEAGALDRFKRELVIAREVSHESLCRVFDFIEHNVSEVGQSAGDRTIPCFTIPCFTMELLEGESLAERLTRARPMSPSDALPIIRQIAEGLQVLHDHGIVHRDLKPSNIMMARRRDGLSRAVVMDFGLAKAEKAEGEFFESHVGFQGGAPYFMAPEMLHRGRPSTASDVYAFGLLIDELITRKRAFAATSLQALYYSKLWEKPLLPSSRADNLPPHWEQTILRCLRSEPSQRFERVTDVVEALENPRLAPRPEPASSSRSWKVLASPKVRRRAFIAAATGIPLMGGAATVAALAFQADTSIEVFQIANQSSDKDLDYFCKGTTSELMRRLMQLRGVRVLPMYAPRVSAPAAKVARFALDGVLQAHNGQIRLAMQFTDNEHGTLLWSDNFDRQIISNPIEVQSEIARGTVTALENRVLLARFGDRGQASPVFAAAVRMREWLALQTGASLPAPPTRSNVAFDLYMRGHNLLEDVSPTGATAAIDYFKQAIAADPEFALAYSALADAQMTLMNYNYLPHPELAREARRNAEIAVQRDANLAEGHAVLAAVRQMDWDWKRSGESYQTALRLKPRLARALRWMAGLKVQFGQFEEGIAEARQAIDIDPYDRSGPPAFGFYLFAAGRYREAVDVLTTALAGKDMVMTRHNLGQVCARLGYVTGGPESQNWYRRALEQARAIADHEKITNPRDGRTSFSDQLYALTLSMMNEPAQAQPYVDRMHKDMDAGGTSPVSLAWVYSIQRQKDRALDLLERAASWRDRRLLYTKVIPFLENVHDQPRFKRLLAEMQL